MKNSESSALPPEIYHEKLDSLRQAIQKGIDQIDRGGYTVYTSKEDLRKLAEKIKRRGREQLAAKRKRGRKTLAEKLKSPELEKLL
jgi:hypothetical protein